MSGLQVLFASHTAELRGGAERYLLELTRGLVGRGHGASVLLPADGPLRRVLEDAGVATDIVHYAGWISRRWRPARVLGHLARNVRAIGPLARAVQKRDPDVIVSNTLYAPIAALVARHLRRPHVWLIHELVHEDLGAAFDLGTRASLRWVDATSIRIVFNSSVVANKFKCWLPAAKACIVHPVPESLGGLASLPRPRSATVLRLCLVGTLSPAKGQLDAIEAIGRLRDRRIEAVLTLAGDGDPAVRRELEQRVRRLHLGGRVDLLGFVADPSAVYAAADVVLVCSRCEAFGRVALEAMAAGRPVVAASSGFLSELISGGRTGLLYPPGDVAALSDAIACLRDPELRERLGQCAREVVLDRFAFEHTLDGVEAVLREAIAATDLT